MYFYSSHMSVSLNRQRSTTKLSYWFLLNFEDSKSPKPKTTRDYYVQQETHGSTS